MLKNFLLVLGGVILAVFIGIVYAIVAYIRRAMDWDR